MVLEFEKPIADLEQKLQEMKELAKGRNINLSKDIDSLESKIMALKKETFANLTRWQRVQLSRHADRPYALDYIYEITNDFIELHGDRTVKDEVSGFARAEWRAGGWVVDAEETVILGGVSFLRWRMGKDLL